MRRETAPVPSKLFEVFVLKSWWVLLLFFGFFFLFDRGMQAKHEEKSLLLEKIKRLENEKAQLIAQKESCKVRLKSEEDWRFFPFFLQERLGVKDEGEIIISLDP
jgi:hypothetical protein